VVDHHRLLVPVVHLTPDPELLHRVEAVERGRTLGVLHGDEPLRHALAPRDDATRLIGMVGPGMRNDLVGEFL
jgi:hypothetical protein